MLSGRTKQYPIISVVSTDEDVLRRAAEIMGATVNFVGRQQDHHKDVWRAALQGRKALDLMQKIRPYMGERRQMAIDHIIENSRFRRLLPQQEIKRRFDEGEKATDLAAEYGCRRESIYRVVRSLSK